MTDTQSLAIDILKIIPDDSLCFIQAPSIDKSAILNLFKPSQFDYYRQIELTKENKNRLGEVITSENIESHFHSLEIKHNNSLLCEAHDGMEMVILSKNMNIPNWFADKYLKTDLCVISSDW